MKTHAMALGQMLWGMAINLILTLPLVLLTVVIATPCENFLSFYFVDVFSIPDGNLTSSNTKRERTTQVVVRIDNIRFDTGFCPGLKLVSFGQMAQEPHEETQLDLQFGQLAAEAVTSVTAAETPSLFDSVPVGCEWANVHVQDVDCQRGKMRTAFVFLDRFAREAKDVVDTGQSCDFVAMTIRQRLGRDPRADLCVKLPRGRLVGVRRIPLFDCEGV